MIGDPAQSATELLIDEFYQRFPLLKKIVGEFGGDGPRERVPWFFGFLLAAANNPNPGGCCFVLDMSTGTTAIAALLTALSRLKADFPRLVEDHARHKFTQGQRVRILPSDAVFEYDGIWPEFPGQFKLKLLGAETRSFRSFPLADVLRLEPTDRLRPRGTGTNNLGQRASGSLDQLLDFSSCGNNSIIRNVVLCHMPRIQFARTVDSITLAPSGANTFERLSQFLSWGSVDPDGLLHANDSHQTVGEPLIAVSGVPEDIARNCRASPANTKVVFADGPQRFARDLQAYDDVVEKQKLILLASPNDIDDIQALRDRGCTIWRMTPGEMLLGESSPRTRSRTSFVGRTVRAGDIRQRTTITTIDCKDEKIEAVARALERASASLDENDQAVELEEALARLFGVLFECSECCFGPPETAIESIESARSAINRNARWLRSYGATNLAEAINGLLSIIKDGSEHTKARALVELLTDRMLGKGESWAVVGRSSRTCAGLVGGLRDHGLNPVVTAISSMTYEREYDGIVLAGWPNDSRFRRLLELAAAPEVMVLTYNFEKKWFERYRAKARQRDCSEVLTSEQRAQIVQMSPFLLKGHEYQSPFAGGDEPTASAQEAPVFQFEARIARRHASFSVPLFEFISGPSSGSSRAVCGRLPCILDRVGRVVSLERGNRARRERWRQDRPQDCCKIRSGRLPSLQGGRRQGIHPPHCRTDDGR